MASILFGSIPSFSDDCECNKVSFVDEGRPDAEAATAASSRATTITVTFIAVVNDSTTTV